MTDKDNLERRYNQSLRISMLDGTLSSFDPEIELM